MLKNILNLDGAQQLSKNEQKEIQGGLEVSGKSCKPVCDYTYCCVDGKCIYCGAH